MSDIYTFRVGAITTHKMEDLRAARRRKGAEGRRRFQGATRERARARARGRKRARAASSAGGGEIGKGSGRGVVAEGKGEAART